MEGMFLNLSPKLTYSVEKKDETGSIQFTHVIEVDETVEDNACMMSPAMKIIMFYYPVSVLNRCVVSLKPSLTFSGWTKRGCRL